MIRPVALAALVGLSGCGAALDRVGLLGTDSDAVAVRVLQPRALGRSCRSSVLGLPLGAVVFRTMIGATDPADGPDIVAMPGVVWVLLAAPVALALTAAVSSLAARQAARLPVVAALRAE